LSIIEWGLWWRLHVSCTCVWMAQMIFGRQRKRERWWLPRLSTHSCYQWQHWKSVRCDLKRPKVGCSSSSWGSKFGQGKCLTYSKGKIEHEKGLCKNGSKTAVRWTKERRKEFCLDLLQRTENEPHLLNFIITCDETWVFTYDPETKWQSMQWKSTSSPRPKNARMSCSKFKTTLIVFCDIQSIVMAEWVPSSQTVNQQNYIEVLTKLHEHVRRKWPELWRNGWILHQDNAPAHNALSVKQLLANKNITVLEHPPYSPDLTPCDFCLFLRIKSVLKGTHFVLVENVKAKMAEILNNLTEHDLRNCFEHWQHRMQLFVNSEGNYFEGECSWFPEFLIYQELQAQSRFLFQNSYV